MATTTPNFGWPVPTSTDLVKDGAVAIEALGDAVDASLLDLKGGTTGQVLAKATNTDMDFAWVAADDTNAIQNAIVDAKGDLIAASAADTPARLAVGNNGETLVADASTSTGLRYQGSMAGGKNAVINGGMDIWQRGTSALTAATSSTSGYTADRWQLYRASFTANATASRQATADTTNVPFLQYGLRVQRTAGDTSTAFIRVLQTNETAMSVPYAGKTVTFSFYGKCGSNFSSPSNGLGFSVDYGTGSDQNFIGGFTGSTALINSNATLTTSYQRFTVTVAIPSTATQLAFYLGYTATGTAGANDWFEISGVQVEVGSVATQFTRAGGTIQGELAACQRYYYRQTPGAAAGTFNNGGAGFSTTLAICSIKFPVTMRVKPTSMDFAGLEIVDYVNAAAAVTSAAMGDGFTTDLTTVNFSVASGLTQFRPYWVRVASAGTGYLGFSAEL